MEPATKIWLTLSVTTLLCVTGTADPLADRAKEVFQKNCYACHGQTGNAKGDIDYILDRNALVASRLVIPKDAKGSLLWERLQDSISPMPPVSVTPRPSPEELQIVKQWIEGGAPDWNSPVPPLPRGPIPQRVGPLTVVEKVAADLGKKSPADQRYFRYFSLVHLANLAEPKLPSDTYRAALTKLVNLLSLGKKIVVPTPIDADGLLYRVDSRELGWTEATWALLKKSEPFFGGGELPAPLKMAASQTVRADWLVHVASRGSLYAAFLRIPDVEKDLSGRLGLDPRRNIQLGQVRRAGFTLSGTENNNRIIERHALALWKSYNFDTNVEKANIFAYPLGPTGVFPDDRLAFEHADSDIIFGLPNGLHAYVTYNAEGKRLPDANANTGIRCLTCHVGGLIHAKDQILASFESRRDAFTVRQAQLVTALYPTPSAFKELIQRDNVTFVAALDQMKLPLKGLPHGRQEPNIAGEPINAVDAYYSTEVPVEVAAAELGLRAEDLVERIQGNSLLSRPLGSLLLKEKSPDGAPPRLVGRVRRDLFEAKFQDILHPPRVVATAIQPAEAPTEVAAGPAASETLACGDFHSCAVTEEGKISCWGENAQGQSRFPANLGRASSVAAGATHTCALVEGKVLCTGSNWATQLNVPDLVDPVQISARGNHTCALDREGVKCWGSNEFTECFREPLNEPTAVSAGLHHTCALDKNGIKCWGDNRFGQCDPLPGLKRVTQIAAGGDHTCALADGKVSCWGRNDYGQINVPPLENPSQVAAGTFFSCALHDGGVRCWGENLYGQAEPPPLKAPSRIVAGSTHACALTEEGVRCWGQNVSGMTRPPPLKPAAVRPPTYPFVLGGFAKERYDAEQLCQGKDLVLPLGDTLKDAGNRQKIASLIGAEEVRQGNKVWAAYDSRYVGYFLVDVTAPYQEFGVNSGAWAICMPKALAGLK